MTVSINDEFEFEVKFSNTLGEVFYWFLVSIIGLGIFSWILDDFVSGIISVIFLIVWGSIVGLLWRKVGSGMSDMLIINPLGRLDINSDRLPLYLRYLIGDANKDSFLQLKTENRELDGPIKILSESGRTILAFAAILVTVSRYLIQIYGIELYGALFISFIFSTLLMTFYIPFSLVVEDSRIMLEQDNGTIKLAGGNVRNILEGGFGITGIISGYSLFLEDTGSVLDTIIIYPVVLILFIIMAVPLMFPTLFVYYHGHEKLVNQVREAALFNQVQPARTQVQRLKSEEIQQLVFNDIIHTATDKSVLTRISSFFNKPEQRVYTKDQRAQIEKLGGWICVNCQFPNSVEEEICKDCNKRKIVED